MLETVPKINTILQPKVLAEEIKAKLMDSPDGSEVAIALEDATPETIDEILRQIDNIAEAFHNNDDCTVLIDAVPDYVKPFIFEAIPVLKANLMEVSPIITDGVALELRAPFNSLFEQNINQLSEINNILKTVASNLSDSPTALELYGEIYKITKQQQSKPLKQFLQDFNILLGENKETFIQLTPEQIKEFINSFIA